MATLSDDTGPIVINGQSLNMPSANAIEGGINGNLFDQFALGATPQGEYTIPVWRKDKVLKNRQPFGADKDMRHDVAYATRNIGQMTKDKAILEFASILDDPSLVKSWAQIALEAGLIKPEQTTDAVALGRAWETAVGWSLNFKEASGGSIELTPFEAAQKVAQNTGSALLARQADMMANFTGDKTITQTTVNDTSPDEGVLSELLGRKPTDGELAAYRHGYSATAQDNPTTTTSTTSFKEGEAVARHDVVTGGFDERQAAIDAAYGATPEVAANQQATTYYDALLQALRAAV